MSAPKLAESIPTVTAPVQIPEAAEEKPSSRAKYLAGVIAGAFFGSLAVGMLIVGLVVS